MKIQPRFVDYPHKIVYGIGERIRVPDFKRYFGGRIGGKAEGLEFFRYALLENKETIEKELGGNVFYACPKTTVLETNLFDEFMEKNNLWNFVSQKSSDAEITAAFLKAEFTEKQKEIFRLAIGDSEAGHMRPLAVRSSTINEDAERASFAGIYQSVLLPNCHPDENVRLAQFEAAIKLVFSSMFSRRARAYRMDRKIPEGSEKMAILAQNVVGRAWETKSGVQIYHPEISFAAFSYNDFAIGDIRAEDGVARIALGLGQGVVEGEERMAVRINLGKPDPPAGMLDLQQTLKIAPNSMYVLELGIDPSLPSSENSFLKKIRYGEHGRQDMIEKYFEWFDGERLINYKKEGSWPVATFKRLVKGQYGKFIEALRTTNEILKSYFGTNVDFEGAADFLKGKDGKDYMVIYVLQARSQIREEMGRVKSLPQAQQDDIVLFASGAAGRGNQKFRFIVHVPPEKFSSSTSWEIGEEIKKANSQFSNSESKEKYLLLVPGRFGSSSLELGVPGDFSSINNSVGIGEYMQGNWEPSQGAHMFESLVGTGKALFSYKEGQLNLGNLVKMAVNIHKEKYVEIYEFSQPLELLIDEQGNLMVRFA